MAKRKKAAAKKSATGTAATKKGTTKTKTSAKKATKKKSSKRELIDTGRDKRFVRRGTKGQFSESDDVGKSLSQDQRKKAKRKVKAGQGDKGDR